MRQIKAIFYTTVSALMLCSSIAHATTTSLIDENAFKPLTDFGSNPGALSASYFKPTTEPQSIVVLLHGCVQDAKQLAIESGFAGLAKTHQFALLLPQQSEKNNIKQCFNWFSPQDTNRDQGETLSLKNMILTLKKQFAVEKVYIAGLSAGGAMTSGLLINYPQLFNGGAIVAGLPYPCADSLIKAISCMRTGPSQSAAELAKLARETSPNTKTWPPLYIMTGSADKVVNPVNAAQIAQQWAQLTQAKAGKKSSAKGFQSQQWFVANKPLIKWVSVSDMGHGISVNPSEKNGGIAAPFIPKAPISAAKDIVKFWKITK